MLINYRKEHQAENHRGLHKEVPKEIKNEHLQLVDQKLLSNHGNQKIKIIKIRESNQEALEKDKKINSAINLQKQEIVTIIL